MIPTQSPIKVNTLDIAGIVSKSSFISERFRNEHLEVNLTQEQKIIAKTRLTRWCKVTAQGNWENFQKRLEWEGWSIAQINQVLATEPISANPALPAWANTLSDILTLVPELSRQKISPNPINSEHPSPFEDVLIPLVFVARQKLLHRLDVPSLSLESLPLKLLSEPAYLSLEKSLLQRLANITAKTLDYEFSHSRPLGKNLLNLLIQTSQGVASKEQYQKFVDKLLADGLLSFFQKYPVLARLISISIDFWVESTGEFLERLEADLPAIQEIFTEDLPKRAEYSNLSELGKVKEIQASLSDYHNQGRSVISLTFTSGLKLIYKPKNLSLEVTYCQLLDWFNQQFTSQANQGIEATNLLFKVLKVLNRGSYGWVEYVEQKPCEDEEAAQRFYQRAGMLLCLLYLLGTSDCHYENLIASGEHLVLIDMETVMHHQAKAMEEFLPQTATSVATNHLFDSVLSTGMLPMWDFSADQSIAFDLSGLGSVESQPAPIPMPVWKFINTDDMYQGFESLNRPLQANIATLQGTPLSPNDYIDELVGGFEKMYRFLIQERDALLATDSPLSAFRSEQVRFIFRPTRIYGRVFSNAMAPECLRSGLDWSIEVDLLSRAFLFAENKPLAWPVLAAELRAVEQLDFPYFNAVTASDTLMLGGGQKIVDYFQQPSYREVVNRLQKFSENDLMQQVGIIQLAFYARVAQAVPAETGNSQIEQREEYSLSALTPEQLVQQASDVASAIEKRAIAGADGSLTWIGLNYVLSSERYQLQPLGDNLYDGNCGIALFLAALAHCTGNPDYRNLTLKSIQSLRESLPIVSTQTTNSKALEMGIGGATGLGSIIYSFVKIGQFLELPQLWEDARLAANLITPPVIATDSKFDIIGGAAGAILGLLALYQTTEDTFILQRAIACGQHLLNYCHSAYNLKNTPTKPLVGFSHGAAGIAYSLLRLYEVTKDNAYLEAASNAIAYETSLFFANAGNWREVTPADNPSSPPVFWSTWCHGAPGIALGRLGGLSIYQTEQILSDIKVALQTTYQTGLQDIDQLCCGNLGRSEIFLMAAQNLTNSPWSEYAQELAAKSVQRAMQTGNYKFFGNLPNSLFHPSFFQGAAGIGYQLLRLAYPKTLPSVLLWQ
ncbi:MAG: type 2 lanthipeptide synthetase LanM family protein [Coleofasciculaceae cyanobacterium]